MHEEASTNLEKMCTEDETNAYLGTCITSIQSNHYESPKVKREHCERRQRAVRRHEDTSSPQRQNSAESDNFSRRLDAHESWPFNFNLLQAPS